MHLELGGKTVLITGASKGIGLATARAFAAEGCHLQIAARSRAPMEAAAAELSAAHGVRVGVHALDLGSDAAMVSLAEACGDVDILVNNAGDIPGGTLEAVGDAAWRHGFDLKVFGYISLCRALYPRMQARGAGVIVNVIGNAGENVDAGYIAGSTGNAGLMAFSRALGGASLDHGIRVVGINPGPVATDRMEKLLRGKARAVFGDPERWRELETRFPGGRAARSEEVADLCLFLASSRAAYISGTIVTIDGGLASRRSIA